MSVLVLRRWTNMLMMHELIRISYIYSKRWIIILLSLASCNRKQHNNTLSCAYTFCWFKVSSFQKIVGRKKVKISEYKIPGLHAFWKVAFWLFLDCASCTFDGETKSNQSSCFLLFRNRILNSMAIDSLLVFLCFCRSSCTCVGETWSKW